MGLFSFLQKQPNREIINRQISQSQAVNTMYETTKNQIQAGISRSTASTGTPMEKLHGAARTTSTLSNIGGGSKETGGGGMAQGLETITKFFSASAAKNILDDQQKQIDK